MPAVRVSLSMEVDGVPVPGSPFIRRMSVDEVQSFDYERATGGGYAAIPSTQLDTVQVLFVRADKQVTLRLDGQSDAGIVLNAGGLLLLFGATVDDGASTNATLDNSSGSTASVEGLAGGT